MSITRRPKPGDKLSYIANWAQNETPIRKPLGTVSSVEGNICWYSRTPGDKSCFIWRFSDGLNQCVRIEE